MKTLIAVVAAFMSAGMVFADTLTLDARGVATLGGGDVSIGYMVHAQGWNRKYAPVAAKAGMAGRFPDAKNGIAQWKVCETDGRAFARGTTTVRPTAAGGASVAYDVTFAEARSVASAVVSLTLPANRFAGGSWAGDAKSGRFARRHNGKTVVLSSFRSSRLTFTDAAGVTLTLTFDAPTQVMLQDNRRWSETFSVRLASESEFAAGARQHCGFVLASSAGPVKVECAQPTVIASGTDWVRVDYRKTIAAGSALDFSAQGLQDAPAGKYGWTKNVNGHFEFERLPGVEQRFYGVNLCFSANVPPHELADELVTRLVRFGYNTIRVHHHERELLATPKRGGLGLDPEKLDRFDYLMAKAIAAGLYVTTDAFVSRPVAWKDIGLAERGDGLVGRAYKHYVALWDPAFENWKAFVKAFLGHVNPYTGRSYLEEPAFALISLVNEGQLTMHWQETKDDPIAQDVYARWLAERRAADPQFLPDAPEKASELKFYGPHGAAMALFMADIERRSAARMTAFLRSLGTKALVTNANNGPHPATMQDVRAEVYGYTDVHFYIDHPKFLEKPWSLPSYIRNQNPVLDTSLKLLTPAYVRLADQPLCVTEWNFSGPGQYRGVGGIMTGAFAALQDWNGLWRFAYSHSARDMEEGAGTPGYFNVATDPLMQASDRASVCLFLRRDLAPFAAGTALRTTEGLRHVREGGAASCVRPQWADAAWGRRVASAAAATRVPAGMDEVPLTDALLQSAKAPFPVAPSPHFALDRARGTFAIVTPRTAGGFAPEGMLRCGDVTFTVAGTPATVWATSVDAEKTSVAEAKRILVTHLTDVQGDGNVYGESGRNTLLRFGRKGPVARAGSAEVRLRLARPEAYRVWALDTSGVRTAEWPARVEGGELVFTASVEAPSARFYYEIADVGR